MGSSSKYGKKRKEVDEDTSEEGHRERHERNDKSRSTSPVEKRTRRRSPSPNNGDQGAESMSIEETNKLRASLGLAPLVMDDGPKVRDADDGETDDKICTENGMEFRHRKADNMQDKKNEEAMREKLETAKQKRHIYDKVLKSKGIADEDEDDEGGTEAWVNRLRQQEEEKKRAQERAKMLDDMDADFGVNSMIEEEKAKKEKAERKKKRAEAKAKAATMTGNMIVGHSKESFFEGAEQILVLEDKGVLDDGEEVLINPNMMENERHAKNVELRKRKGLSKTAAFDEDLDEWGNPKDHGLLAKYDKELEGEERKTFRLDDAGEVDVEKERREIQMRRDLMMAGKKLVSLDTANKFTRASEFYTQEEMISFRKPKKAKDSKKTRKRGKVLRAEDLVPEEPAGENSGSRRRRRHDDDEAGDAEKGDGLKEVKMEEDEGELKEGSAEPAPGEEGVNKKWKKATRGAVDIAALKKIAQADSDADDDSDDDLMGGVELGAVMIDDEAEDELGSVLAKARRIKQMEVRDDVNVPDAAAKRVINVIQQQGGVKMEVDDDDDVEEVPDGGMCIDSTMEYCRNIGEIPTYGLAGNRTDAIDVSELQLDKVKTEQMDEEEKESESVLKWKKAQAEKERRKKAKKVKMETEKGGWRVEGEDNARIDSDDERELKEAQGADSGSDDEAETFGNVLGDEADVTKGVGAMLKLAAQKGYLEGKKKNVHGDSLKHLENQRFTQVEQGRMDIDEKYTRKLERMGTMTQGPSRDFCEKKEYNPEVHIEYPDNQGRLMNQKEAYRTLSYKFHGRAPGKRQMEKRNNQAAKKELLKKMNSSDTPLGTLSRQREKQEQLQTPYLVLSGGRGSDSTTIKKE